MPADLSSAGFPPPCRPSDSPSKQQRRVARCQHRDVCIVLDADRQPSIQAPPVSQCRGSAHRLPTRDAKFRRRCRALQDTQEVHDLCRSHHSLMIFFLALSVETPPPSSPVLFSLMTCYIRGTSVQLQQLKYQTFFLRLLSLRFTSVVALSCFRRENSSLCVTALAQVTFLQTCDYFRPVFFICPLPSCPVCLGELSQAVTPTQASHPHLASFRKLLFYFLCLYSFPPSEGIKDIFSVKKSVKFPV